MKKIISRTICCSFFCFTILAHPAYSDNARQDGAVKVVAASSPESVQNPAFSPDGSTMIYTVFHEGYNKGPAAIYSCPSSGGSSVALIDEEDNDSVNLPGTSWNAATNRITFASDRVNTDEIWTMSPDGSNLRQVTHHTKAGYYIEPSFSPDGQWIVFEADNTEPDDTQQGSIYKVRADGSEIVKLTDGPAGGTDDRQPNWSPAGDTILFQRRAPGADNWDIYTMNPDGRGLRQVTTTDSGDTDASFSPDGKWIVFSTDYGGLEVPNIFIIPATGGTPVRITKRSVYEDGAPSWSPDGRWIAFETHKGADENMPSSIWRIAVTVTTAEPVTAPKPLITANGIADAVSVHQSESLTLALCLDAAAFLNRDADWWLLHVGPGGSVEYFDINSMAFKAGVIPTLQGGLVSFNTFPLPAFALPDMGIHQFYFGVDTVKNGSIDAASIYYDSVEVTVSGNSAVQPSGGYKAKAVYNQAYQENFVPDTIPEIIRDASNAYVLIDPFYQGISKNIADIRKNSNEVGCYISIGTGEDWRSDFNQLKPYLVSKPWGEWAGEYFVNQTTTGIIPVMKARIDQMAVWHCDWVEFDNMDWAFDETNRSAYGFQVTEAEATAYFQELCAYVHQKGMKCTAKNMVEGASDFDGVLYESYNDKRNWWDSQGMWDFLKAGKLVIVNHYNETDCDKAYQDYMQLYNSDISFICEDANLKKYVHYNQSSNLHSRLMDSQTWMYQIQGLDADGALDALAVSDYPLLVIEPGHNFKDYIYDTAAMLKKLRKLPDATERLLLAYIDIGQAEDYRDYWQDDWKAPADGQHGYPDFLITVDPDGWSGNYPVAYWRQDWKDLWLSSQGIIARLADFGFDGVYLDWVEAYDDDYVRAAADKDHVNPELEMIKFVEEIGQAGKKVISDFLVVPQNAPYLIDAAPDRYAAAIDALAVEDTWFHGTGDADWNSPQAGDLHERHEGKWSTENRIQQYQKYFSRDIPVFSVDYCISRDNACQVYHDARNNGLRPLVTRVALSQLSETPPSLSCNTIWINHPVHGAVVEIGYGGPEEYNTPPYPSVQNLTRLRGLGVQVIALEFQYAWTIYPPYMADETQFSLLKDALDNVEAADLYR